MRVFTVACLMHTWRICSSSLVERCALGILCVCYANFFKNIHQFVYHVWKMMQLLTLHCGSLTHTMHLALWTWVGSSVVSSFPCILHLTMNFIGSCFVHPICKWRVLSPHMSVPLSLCTLFLMSGRCLDCATCVLIFSFLFCTVFFTSDRLFAHISVCFIRRVYCKRVCASACEWERKWGRERLRERCVNEPRSMPKESVWTAFMSSAKRSVQE